MKQYVECGTVSTAHGIKGEIIAAADMTYIKQVKKIRLESISGKSFRDYELTSVRGNGNKVIIKLKGLDDRTEAEGLKGMKIKIDRDEVTLQKDVYFIDDVIGLEVFDREGKAYGKVTDVFTAGRKDVYTVTDKDGTERLIPAIKESEIEIDVEKGTLLFTVMEGLFD